MRWPFRRSESPPTEPDDAREGDAGDGPGSADDVAAPAAVPDPATPPAWASLPPLQRTIADRPALTAPTAELFADVAQRLSPTTTLEPLGHDIGPLAPRGTIGLAAPPVEASGPRPDLVGRTVRPATAQRMSSATPDASAVIVDGREPTPPAGVLPPPERPRSLEVIEAVAPPATADRSLLSAADPAGPTAPASATTANLVVARSADHATPSGPSASETFAIGSGNTPTIDVVEAARPIRRPGLGAPIGSGALHGLQRTADLAPSSAAIAGGGAPGGPDRAEPSQPPPTVHGPRPHVQRLAIGESLVVRPARVPAVPPPGVSGPETAAQNVVQRAPEADAVPPRDRSGAQDVADPGLAGSAVTVGRIDVSRLASGSQGHAVPSVRSTRLLVGRIEPSSVQRQAAAPKGAEPTGDAPTGTGPALSQAERSIPRPPGQPEGPQASGPPRSEIAVARFALPEAHYAATTAPWIDHHPLHLEAGHSENVNARSSNAERTGSPPIIAARAIEDDARPLPDLPHATRSTPPGPDNRPTMPRVGVQRSVGETTSPVPPPALPLARAASVPVGTAEVQRSTPFPMADGPTVVRTAMDGSSPSSDPDRGSPTTIDGEVSEDAMVQRASADEDLSAAAQSAPAAPGAGPTPVGGSEKDLDELARRLYDRFRLRLSRELLVDRERAGALTDL